MPRCRPRSPPWRAPSGSRASPSASRARTRQNSSFPWVPVSTGVLHQPAPERRGLDTAAAGFDGHARSTSAEERVVTVPTAAPETELVPPPFGEEAAGALDALALEAVPPAPAARERGRGGRSPN